MALSTGGLKETFAGWVRDFYFSTSGSILGTVVQWILSPVVLLYASTRFVHQTWRQSQSTRLDVPVVSVGNISIGGTGKTPFVKWLIEEVVANGLQPGLLKRGEGQKEGIITGNSNPTDEVALHYGDEVALFLEQFRNLVVGVGANRTRLAKELLRNHSVDFLILDDGFQYRQIERDIDVVLLRNEDVTNNWQLPAGPLREPLSALSRADYVSVYGSTEADPVKRRLDDAAPGVTRLSHSYVFQGIFLEEDEVTERFRNNTNVLVTTLARPAALEVFLEQQGISARSHRKLPDHANPTPVIREVVGDDRNILVTEKEWVKLPSELRTQVGVIRSRLDVSHGEKIIGRLNEFLSDSAEKDTGV